MANQVSKIKSTTSGTVYELIDEEARKALDSYAGSNMPEASEKFDGRTYHYLGNDDGSYKHAYFYTCEKYETPSEIKTVVTSSAGFSDTPQVSFDPYAFLIAMMSDSDISKLGSKITMTLVASDLSKVHIDFEFTYKGSAVTKSSNDIVVSDINLLVKEVQASILDQYKIVIETDSTAWSYIIFNWTEEGGGSAYQWVQQDVQPSSGSDSSIRYYDITLKKSGWDSEKSQKVEVDSSLSKNDVIINFYPTESVDKSARANFYSVYAITPRIEQDKTVTCYAYSVPSEDLIVRLVVVKN